MGIVNIIIGRMIHPKTYRINFLIFTNDNWSYLLWPPVIAVVIDRITYPKDHMTCIPLALPTIFACNDYNYSSLHVPPECWRRLGDESIRLLTKTGLLANSGLTNPLVLSAFPPGEVIQLLTA